MFQVLSQSLGDTVTHRIPLRWGNRPFVPGSQWHLVFTAKSDPEVADELAEIQLELGNGVTASGDYALVGLTPPDTEQLPAGTLQFDIQAEHLDSDEVRTVARGRLAMLRDVTHTRKSVPTPPLPGELPGELAGAYLTPDEDQYFTSPDGEYYAQPDSTTSPEEPEFEPEGHYLNEDDEYFVSSDQTEYYAQPT